MRNIHKHFIHYFAAVALGVASMTLPGIATARDNASVDIEPTGGEMLADAFLVRPFMLVGTVLTTATFVVTLPLSALGGNVDDAAKTLVYEPAKYTFVRPLGDM